MAQNGWKRALRAGASWLPSSAVRRGFCGCDPSLSSPFAAVTQSTVARPFSAAKCGLATAASNRWHQQPRFFSSGRVVIGAEPILDMEGLQQSIMKLAPSMVQGLINEGYWTTTTKKASILPMNIIELIRQQSVELRRQGRFEQSWSERVVGGVSTERFDKEGVFACEPDGQDYDTAPDMIVYMSVLLQTLPLALNQAFGLVAPDQPNPELSNSSFNAKLAVTLPGGSTYPLHVDNPQGLAANDTRKLTCILYLNPDYDASRGDGGELRLVLGNDNEQGDTITTMTTPPRQVDLTPEGGRMVLFWSDEIPHEVLPTAPGFFSGDAVGNIDEIVDNPLDRYALTLWIPTDDISTIHNESSQFRSLRELAFPVVSS
eukprot:scaffold34628_cov166-Amphora_coffeaeformis.AAC.5